jgi:3-hydroxybutyryl-CoA dehydrogenase
MKEIKTVGIIGFGVMGAAIGINAAMSGYRVVFKELNDELVQTMFDKWVVKSLEKRVAKGKITQADMDAITGMISGTSRYEALSDCDLIIEAAIEKMDLKIQIFEDLSSTCREDVILVSNTSTFLIETLMAKVSNQGRTAGLHYFFPANINRLVEVIRQKNTSDNTYQALMAFAEKCRKTAITVKDFPGFAINPLFISSYMVLDSFLDKTYNVATLESISQEVLNVRYGIMWVQNGSGMGTCYHAGVSMFEYLNGSDLGYPNVPDQLKAQFESGDPWNLTDGEVATDQQTRDIVKDRLLGNVFTIAAHLVENDVVSVTDLELGVCTALAWPKGPFGMMNDLGMEETTRLIQQSVAVGDYKMPKKFQAGVPEKWEL